MGQAHPVLYGLLCASCPSGREFASGFLQIPPRGGHPCRRLMVTVINPIVDFHHRVIIHAGRTPRSRREAAVTSVHALVVRCPLLPLVKVVEIYIKKEEKLRCGRLRMRLAFFRRAVRAEGTRALLTMAVGMLAVLVNLLMC